MKKFGTVKEISNLITFIALFCATIYCYSRGYEAPIIGLVMVMLHGIANKLNDIKDILLKNK